MKRKFIATIEEMVSQDFTIEAKSLKEARALAIKRYRDGDIVLEPGNCYFKQIMVKDDKDNEISDWTQF